MKTKKLFLMALSCVLALSLCSCGKSDDAKEPLNIAVVTAIANQNPLVDASLIDELAQLPSTPGSHYSFILADGAPFVMAQGTIADLSDRMYSSAMMNRVQQSIKAGFDDTFAQAAPVTPGVDLEAALRLGARSLCAADTSGKPVLVIYASGISTCGLVNMVDTPIYSMDIAASVADIVQNLDEDLSSVSVVFYGIGDISGDQQPLSPEEVRKLKEFWKSLCLEMGAESVDFSSAIPPAGAYAFAPVVACMPTEGIRSLLSVNDADAANEVLAAGGVAAIDIRFRADSAIFEDDSTVRAQIQEVLDYLQAYPSKKLIVCGTTARNGDAAACRKLSLQRAVTVCALLRENISADRLLPIGVGFSSSFYVDEQSGSSGWNEAVARKNRSVKFLVYRSDAANQLLASCEYAVEDLA